MRLLIVLGVVVFSFSIVPASAQAPKGKMSRHACADMVTKSGCCTSNGMRTKNFAAAVNRCMKGQPI
jgi:hypothetical protein